MAYLAQLDQTSTVIQVVAVANENCPDPAPDNERQGAEFLAAIGLPGIWKQCSYHGNIRKQYPGPGYTYDWDADVFISPQPYPSWTLDSNYDWQPPVPYPTDGGAYDWNEQTQSWQPVG